MDDGSVRCGVERSRAPKSTSSELSSLDLKFHTFSVAINTFVVNVMYTHTPSIRLVNNECIPVLVIQCLLELEVLGRCDSFNRQIVGMNFDILPDARVHPDSKRNIGW